MKLNSARDINIQSSKWKKKLVRGGRGFELLVPKFVWNFFFVSFSSVSSSLVSCCGREKFKLHFGSF